MYKNNIGITSNRLNEILNYNHYVDTNDKRNFVFECFLTIDERYFIIHDEVFDITEQKKLGYMWDSVDVLKTIFSNVNVNDSEYKIIQEEWRKIPILENGNNLYHLRDFLLEFNFLNDTWIGKKLKSTGQGMQDFASTSFDGIKKMGVAIGKGEWSEILNLLSKGTIYILRKLKEAAYSTLGMVVDAILVSTGIGKGAQMAAWGLITALDVYQLSTNNWPEEQQNDPMWLKFLELGFDIFGLVSAGVAAKGARAIFRPYKAFDITQMASAVSKKPKLKNLIVSIYNASKSGTSKLSSLQKTIMTKWPTGGKFIASILGKMEGLVKQLQTYCGKIIGRSNLKSVKNVKTVPGKGYVATKTGKDALKTGAKSGAMTGGILYGFDKGAEKYAEYKTGLNSTQLSNLSTLDSLGKKYGDKDPFD
jgi:hypothetical protein